MFDVLEVSDIVLKKDQEEIVFVIRFAFVF